MDIHVGQSNHRSLKAGNFFGWKQRHAAEAGRGGRRGGGGVKDIGSMIGTDMLLLALRGDPHARS